MDLETFTKILSNIQKHEEDNRKLTELVVSKDCTGFCSFGEELLENVVSLLSRAMNDEHGYICWWLWDRHDGYVWDKKYRYNLSDPKDLYYYLKGDFDKVTKSVRNENELRV